MIKFSLCNIHDWHVARILENWKRLNGDYYYYYIIFIIYSFKLQMGFYPVAVVLQ
jgi:hypothetical protein